MLSLYIKSRCRTIDLVFPAAKFSINLFKFTQSETKRFLFQKIFLTEERIRTGKDSNFKD